MKLRPYQDDAVTLTRKAWESHQSALIVQPTGTGKTVVFAHLLRHLTGTGRVLVIAHREELIWQAAHKIAAVTGIEPAIEMAEMRAEAGLLGTARVVVSTIQTQTSGRGGGRMTRFDPRHFSLVVIDEAHHATAATYRRLLAYYRQNPDLKVLGVTATPDRHDEAALGQIFECVSFNYELPQAITDGWLTPIVQRVVTVEGLDFSHIDTRNGDLAEDQLAALMEEEGHLHEVATPAYELAAGRKTLIFAVRVHHAERLCEILNRHKPNCARWLCGKTPKEERRAMLRAYAEGRFQFLVNVNVATEGFDEPGIQLVVMARPTKSRALYAQMAGRGTRPLPGLVDGLETAAERRAAILASPKPACEILDFVGNSGRHHLVTTIDLLGGRLSDAVQARARKKIAEAGGAGVNTLDALSAAERELAEEERRQRYADVRAKAAYSAHEVSAFYVFGLTPRQELGWEVGKPLTTGQKAALEKAGINTRGLTCTQASQLLSEVFRRQQTHQCTFKQARKLAQYGYRTDIPFAQANEIIGAIAKNGWKPVDPPAAAEAAAPAEEPAVTIY